MRRVVSRIRTIDAAVGGPLQRRVRRISELERREEARASLEAYHDAVQAGAAARRQRWAEVRRQLSRSSYYEHTPEELAFAARLAWRNHARCIRRLFWESLEVFDCRQLADSDAMAERMDAHLREANHDGRIRAIISIFAPVRGNDLPAWSESDQISRYACHRLPGGQWLGDRMNIEDTQTAVSMGWRPEGEPGRFDLLPWFMRDPEGRRIRYDLKAGSVRELAIRHPLGAVRRVGCTVVHRSPGQQHDPHHRGDRLSLRALQRLLHGHGDRLA